MPTTTLKQKFLRPIVVTSLLLTASMLLSQSACGRKESGEQNVNLAQANMNTAIQEAPTPMSQDPLADNLILVMKDWSGLELARLERNSALSSMWVLRHSSSRPYDPQGIKSLIDKIRENSYFKNTPKAKAQAEKLRRGFFVVGGGIQNQGQLYDFLAV